MITVPIQLASTAVKLTAKAINYGSAQLTWNAITNTNLPSIDGSLGTPTFTLVRKVSGFPQGIADGDVVRTVGNRYPSPVDYTFFDTTANYFVFDTGSAVSYETDPFTKNVVGTKYQGDTLYYALFLAYPDTGEKPFRNVKVAETSVAFVKDNGTLQYMLDHLPEVYKKDATGGQNADLISFMSLYAFHYDMYKTHANTVFTAMDTTKIDDTLIKLLLKQFGSSYDDVQDVALARLVLQNSVYLTANSGTTEGLLEFIKAYSGYNASITKGKNLIQDYNTSSFEEGLGFWYPTVDEVTSPFGNGYATGGTKATCLTKVGPVLSGIAAYNNQQGPTLTGASSSSTTVTVESTAGLYPGTAVQVTAGTGVFAVGTVVTEVTSILTFKVSATPTTPLSGATIAVSDNMLTGMMKFIAPVTADASFAIRPKITKVTSSAIAAATTLSVAAGIPAVNDYVINSSVPYGTYVTAFNSGTSTVTLSSPLTSSVAVGDEVWFSSSSMDKTGASTAFLPLNAASIDHTFSIYVNRGGNTARAITAKLRWRDGSGTIISTGSETTLSSGSQSTGTAWYRLSVTGTAPSNAVYCEPIITIKSCTAGDIYFFDAAQWEQSSSATFFEDARLTKININAVSVNYVTNPTYWHSTTSATSFTSPAGSLEPTVASGSVTFPFTSSSGAFGSVSPTFDEPVSVVKAVGTVTAATGSTAETTTVTYTTAGNHQFLVGQTPKIYNMSYFQDQTSESANNGNGFDITAVNSAALPISSVTNTTFTITKPSLTITGVTSYLSGANGDYYIVVTDDNYDKLWVGAAVRVSAGTGNLSKSITGKPIITSITKNAYNSDTGRNDIFYLDVKPYQTLTGATIVASLGQGGLSSTSLSSTLPTAVASYSLSYTKGRNIYYNKDATNYGTSKGIDVITGLPYTFAISRTHTIPSSNTYQEYSPYAGAYRYTGLSVLPYISFTNGADSETKIPMTALIKSISRSGNTTTFTTLSPHNFQAGDFVYLSNVKVTPTGSTQINYSFDAKTDTKTGVSGTATQTGVPHYVLFSTSTTFSTRHSYSVDGLVTYDYDGVNYSNTAVDLVEISENSGTYYPPVVSYAVTSLNTTTTGTTKYLSMTASPYPTRTVVPWNTTDSAYTKAIPGFYLVELFGTPDSITGHTVSIEKTFFSAATEFKNYFDGYTDPNNRAGGYLDTLWNGTAGESSSSYYLNLASVSTRLRHSLTKILPYTNTSIEQPNKTATLLTAVVDSTGLFVTFTSSLAHDINVDNKVSVTGFSSNTAVNTVNALVVNVPSTTSFIVSLESAISTGAASGTGLAYVSSGWSNQYRLIYADPTYGAPYNYGDLVRYVIFTLSEAGVYAGSDLNGSDILG